MPCDGKVHPFEQIGSYCIDKCGDGLVLTPDLVSNLNRYNQCDDGNEIDGDGCSSRCVVESGYLCSYDRDLLKSVCRYSVKGRYELVWS